MTQHEDGASASNATEANTNEVTEETETSDDGNNDKPQQDINTLLATSMNLVTDNYVVRDYIANTSKVKSNTK